MEVPAATVFTGAGASDLVNLSRVATSESGGRLPDFIGI